MRNATGAKAQPDSLSSVIFSRPTRPVAYPSIKANTKKGAQKLNKKENSPKQGQTYTGSL